MPTYIVTDSKTGKKLSLTGDSPPTEAELEQIFASQGAPETEPSSFLGRTADVVSRVTDTLGRGSAAVAATVNALQNNESPLTAIKETFTPTGLGTFKQNVDFDEVLEDAGMEEGWKRAALGMTLDIATDPLSYAIPAKAVGRVLTGGAKLAGKGIKALPGAKTVAEAFIPHAGLGDIAANAGSALEGLSYKDVRRLGDSTWRGAGEQAEALSEEVFSGIKKADRQRLAYALDKGELTGDANLDALVPVWRQKMDELFQDQIELGNLSPKAKIKNYVQYLTKSGSPVDATVGSIVSTRPRSARTREVFDTLQDAVTHGEATDDAMEIFSRSIAQVERAKTSREFLERVAENFATDKANGRLLKVDALNMAPKLKKQFDNVYLPHAVADDLERALVLWEKPTEMDNLLKTGIKLFKATATSINPAHHVTNLMGNIHNMYIAGMSPLRIAKGYREGYKAVSKDVFPAIGKYSSDEIAHAAKRYEMTGSATQLGELTGEGTAAVVNNPLFRFARQRGQRMVEDPARLGLFFDEIRKGKTLEQAAIRVKDVLFDYSELTKTEKAIRDYGVVPFYTWMRKNIPLQFKMAAENPGRVAKVGNVLDVPWDATESQFQDIMVNEDRQAQGYVPSPYSGPHDLPVMQRLAFPITDINKITSARSLLDMLGPQIKAPMEYYFNERTSGAPVRRTDGPTPGWSKAAPLAQILGLGLDPALEAAGFDDLRGIISSIDVAGAPMQRDIPSWLMSHIPSTSVGSTLASGGDPRSPGLPLNQRMLAYLLGLSPDVVTPQDQLYEFRRRIGEMKRDEFPIEALLEP